MNNIKFEELVGSENPNIAVPGSKVKLERLRKAGGVCVETTKEYFYTRNWLMGNRLSYDTIIVFKDSAKTVVKESEDTVKQKRLVNLAKARAARKAKADKAKL